MSTATVIHLHVGPSTTVNVHDLAGIPAICARIGTNPVEVDILGEPVEVERVLTDLLDGVRCLRRAGIELVPTGGGDAA